MKRHFQDLQTQDSQKVLQRVPLSTEEAKDGVAMHPKNLVFV